MFDERRAIGPAAVQRYFVRLPADATLRVTVTLPDSQAQQATVRLYEPNGAPARSAPEDMTIGQEDPGTALITVRAEDMVAGVYELDVIAPPLEAAIVTVRADVGPVALATGLVHVSNLYRSEPAEHLAEELVARSFASSVFFCNSGAEANEAAFKFARRWARERRGDAVMGLRHPRAVRVFFQELLERFLGFNVVAVGEAGRRAVLEKFNAETMAAKMLSVFRELAAMNPQPSTLNPQPF